MKRKLCLICHQEVAPEEIKTKDTGLCITVLVYKVTCPHCGTSVASYDEHILDFYADVPEVEEVQSLSSIVDKMDTTIYNGGNTTASPINWFTLTNEDLFTFTSTMRNDRNSGDNFGNR